MREVVAATLREVLSCQNSEASMMFKVGEWIDELRYLQKTAYYSALKRNELLSNEMICRELRCILISERSQSVKATYYVIENI